MDDDVKFMIPLLSSVLDDEKLVGGGGCVVMAGMIRLFVLPSVLDEKLDGSNSWP